MQDPDPKLSPPDPDPSALVPSSLPGSGPAEPRPDLVPALDPERFEY